MALSSHLSYILIFKTVFFKIDFLNIDYIGLDNSRSDLLTIIDGYKRGNAREGGNTMIGALGGSQSLWLRC